MRWEPFALNAGRSGTIAAEVGRIRVPERRDVDGSPAIDLVFVRLRTANPSPAPPLVYLDGGPGGDAYGIARVPAYLRLLERIRAERDVILLSQRGTGLSRPRLACRSDGPLPDDLLVGAESMRQALEPRLRACADQLRASGVTLSAYTSEASADDVDDVRRALGVPTVALLGFSYGTHLALEVMRRHPSGVERAVLVGTEGAWHTLKYPRALDAQFGRLARAARPVVPDLAGAWRVLLARAAAEPLRVEVTLRGEPRTALVGAGGLQWLLRRDLGDTGDWPWIPSAIAQAAVGDVDGLRPVVQRRLGQLSSGIALMGIAMDCASGASPARLAEIRAEARSSMLGVMTNFPYPDVCETLGLPALPEAFRAPFASDTPALFVRGTLDGNTPPWQADEVSARFTRDHHLTVEGAGHESMLPDAAVQDVIVGFLQGETDLPARLEATSPLFTPRP